jgi:hypothetical protein
MIIFKEKPLKDQSFLQKIFKKLPKQNAIIELNNLLSQNEDHIETIPISKIRLIEEKYKTKLKKSEKVNLIELFKVYLNYSISDKKLDKTKINTLDFLKTLLQLDDYNTQDLINNATQDIFNEEVKKVFNSGPMDDSKWTSLKKLKSDLLINSKEEIDIYRKNAMEIIEKFMMDAIADRRYSPEEEQKLSELARNFGVDLKIDNKTQQTLEKFKLYWEIENGKLPIIRSDINLQKSEDLHFMTYITWQEQRKVRTRYNYAGPTARIKIVKGVYYRFGSMSVQPQSEDVWQAIDSGNLFMTNKRLIFMGARGNKTIPINKILDFTPYSNGVDIHKDSGKSPFLKFDDTELFSMILSRLME